METEHELFGELHEQEENGLFGNEHRRQYEAQQEALRLSTVSSNVSLPKQNNMDKKIKTLRTFFRASNIAFDCAMSMGTAFGGKSIISPMHELHKLALIEIEKENPDLSIIDDLLGEMEKLAEQMKLKPNFPKGGV